MAACRCAASLLLVPPEGEKAEGSKPVEGAEGGGENDLNGDAGPTPVGSSAGSGSPVFPLDIDQEVCGSATIFFGSWGAVGFGVAVRLASAVSSLGNVSRQPPAEGRTLTLCKHVQSRSSKQQMQLMREMYHLGEVQAWETMLPSTKQRLREASRAATVSEDDSRAFWYVIGRRRRVAHEI